MDLTGESLVESELAQTRRVPRIVPTPAHMDAMVGIWELDGEMINLVKEPDTGVLVAMTTRGIRVNPLRVISHGSKMGRPVPE
jgi:hypothetical protein